MRSAVALLFIFAACGSSGPPDPIATPGATPVQSCGSAVQGACTCSGGKCDVGCSNQTSCDVDCSGGSECGVVACRGDTTCTVACSGGGSCQYVDCRGVTDCSVNCSGGSTCDVNCANATGCGAICSGGSPCLLYCGGTTNCTFTECSGGSGATTSCPGDIIVCNRKCPTCGDGVCDRVASETCASCPKDCGGC
jgi:hypothetical protein